MLIFQIIWECCINNGRILNKCQYQLADSRQCNEIQFNSYWSFVEFRKYSFHLYRNNYQNSNKVCFIADKHRKKSAFCTEHTHTQGHTTSNGQMRVHLCTHTNAIWMHDQCVINLFGHILECKFISAWRMINGLIKCGNKWYLKQWWYQLNGLHYIKCSWETLLSFNFIIASIFAFILLSETMRGQI